MDVVFAHLATAHPQAAFVRVRRVRRRCGCGGCGEPYALTRARRCDGARLRRRRCLTCPRSTACPASPSSSFSRRGRRSAGRRDAAEGGSADACCVQGGAVVDRLEGADAAALSAKTAALCGAARATPPPAAAQARARDKRPSRRALTLQTRAAAGHQHAPRGAGALCARHALHERRAAAAQAASVCLLLSASDTCCFLPQARLASRSAASAARWWRRWAARGAPTSATLTF